MRFLCTLGPYKTSDVPIHRENKKKYCFEDAQIHGFGQNLGKSSKIINLHRIFMVLLDFSGFCQNPWICSSSKQYFFLFSRWMGTSEVFNSRIDHKNRTHNPLPPKNPLETIVTPTFANLDFRPPPFSSIFTIGNPIVNQLLRVAIFMDFHGFSLKIMKFSW